MASKTIRHVLKATDVTLLDPLELSIDPGPATGSGGSKSATSGSKARIAQTHPDHAVIEVTCSCGRTTYVRCDYAAASPAPAGQKPAQK